MKGGWLMVDEWMWDRVGVVVGGLTSSQGETSVLCL